MSRRGRSTVNRFQDGSRASIGDYYVDQACNALNKAMWIEATMFVQPIEWRALLPMVIPDDVMDKLRAAAPYASMPGLSRNYDMRPHAAAYLAIDFDGMGIIPPHTLMVHPERWEPLREKIVALDELRKKWGAVKYVLRWCNRNMTPGAVRNIWPSALALSPDSPNMKEMKGAAPVRYDQPARLGEMLPLIRYTAGIVAGMQMLPSDVTPRKREGVCVTLDEPTAMVEGCQISLEQATFNT